MTKKITHDIFIDFSNIFVGAQLSDTRSDGKRELDKRLNPRTLTEEVERGRVSEDITTRRVVGSKEASHSERVWELFRECGYQCDLQERIRGQKESFVDEVVMNQILLLLLEYSSSAKTVRNLVLMTGDGNQNDNRANFPKVIRMWLERGGTVELWSWARCTSNVYYTMEKEFKDGFKIIELDRIRDKICFSQKLKYPLKQTLKQQLKQPLEHQAEPQTRRRMQMVPTYTRPDPDSYTPATTLVVGSERSHRRDRQVSFPHRFVRDTYLPLQAVAYYRFPTYQPLYQPYAQHPYDY